MTIADFDRKKGTVTIIFQEVGKSTKILGQMDAGEIILDFVVPLGNASHFDGSKNVAVIGWELGTVVAYPQAKKLCNMGIEVHSIIGFRNKDLIILQKEMEVVSKRLVVATDDGSNGNKSLLTDILKKLIEEGNKYDLVIVNGSLIMMKAVSTLTKEYGIKTIVGMNPVMVDGIGMCGGCRVTVGGETKFACIDGPDFDGHQVDFDEAIRRQGMYKKEENNMTKDHVCRLDSEESEKAKYDVM